jgi:hypothetical protein
LCAIRFRSPLPLLNAKVAIYALPSSKTFTCKATVTVTVGTQLVGGATVDGQWSVTNGAMTSFPYNERLYTSSKGNDLGAVTSTSQKINNANRGCRFTVTQLMNADRTMTRVVSISAMVCLNGANTLC